MSIYINQTPPCIEPPFALQNEQISFIPNHAQEEAAIAKHLGGGQFNTSFDEVVPNDFSKVDSIFSSAKKYFNQKIGTIFPAWNKRIWLNSAKTLQNLRKDTQIAAPKFVEGIRTICSQLGVQPNFGPNDCCALKKEGSLRRKIVRDSKNDGISIEKTIQLVGDAIRGTIIVDFPDQVSSVVNAINEWAQHEGWEVGWKNLFQDERDREDGYAGIHGKILLRFKNHKGEERQILTELQIHFTSIVDGSSDSPKERMHLLYEKQKEIPNPLAPHVSKLSFLSGLSSIGNICRIPKYFLSWHKEGLDQQDDLCKDRDYAYICEGNLGIPRYLMPQLPNSSATRSNFLREEKNQGIIIQEESIPADNLTPTQNELNRDKVEKLRRGSYNPCDGEILVATGNPDGKKYVIDGHHRYAACRLNNGTQKILAIGENIRSILSKLSEFAGVERRDITNRIVSSHSENQQQVNEIGKEIKDIASIQSKLDQLQSVVVSGAAGSGKSELLHLALSDEAAVFDLREQFLAAYYKSEGISDPGSQNDFRKNQYQTEQFKKKELHWLTSEFESIKAQLIGDANHTVIFDEFDLAVYPSETTDEIANKIILLAEACRDAGKKVALIIHPQTKRSNEIINALVRGGFIQNDNDIVQTGFLSRKEQNFLLNKWRISGNSAKNFVKQTSGLPAAYLPILRDPVPSTGNINQLFEALNTQIMKIYSVVKKSSPQNASNLIALASGNKQIDANSQVAHELLETGLIKVSNGVLFMPSCVKQALSLVFGNSKAAEN